MKFLLRSEELVLMAVWKLQEEAYCVPIREFLMKVTGKNWSFGSIYDPLDRLEKRGFLESFTSEPVKERGGRRKRIYHLTKAGKEALLEMRSIHDMLWKTMPELKI
jgi:DNA-binding PadR family transcriptional regulator